MGTIFFKTNPTQDVEIKNLMANEGYTNKAEFFRFLVKYYKHQNNFLSLALQKELNELGEILQRKNKEGKLKDNLNEAFAQLQNPHHGALSKSNKASASKRSRSRQKSQN